MAAASRAAHVRMADDVRYFVVTFVFLVAACPRDNTVPPAPTEARTCVTLADCNGGQTCGLLSACVAGFCEAETSLDLPCPVGH